MIDTVTFEARQVTKIEMKYSFPLFATEKSLVNLGKNEKLIISDIWSFWDYVVKKVSKNDKKRDS